MAILIILIFLSALLALLLYLGIVHINNPSKAKYPVNGVDVSAYQGQVDWDTLSSQDIDFAYIKATEGSTFKDSCFEYNWKEAGETDLRIGAYHFFSFESSGEKQAANFIDSVDAIPMMLPPVIDVEYYGKYQNEDDIDVVEIRAELRNMINILKEEYGVNPVLYVSEETYNTIVAQEFSDCDIWYRSVYGKIDGDLDWTFWQYSNRHRLNGYEGEEPFIDMNVFYGTKEEFESYGTQI
ncbi:MULTISPECIES: GH25 family lysozyme [Pseudobutyrivibrio]|uniref:Glycoside hydrolase family 25 n=1 Tax=Pseudobutyrivibrio xylanivorans TaxID=185007 RepID=A0A6M0LES8_PSEXY|nr:MULTISPECIES: GH25 family lysozyme [Pseudobutyrivibrio]NEX00309.1 glycoside hydrolase family 25 [Pseudobutyrivibrio xylanivorans]